jgi:predicted signal transduction protein with EAL and GGDEF domain
MTVGARVERSPFGFLAAVVSSAVSAGLLVITGTVLVVDALRPTGDVGHPDRLFYVLMGGTLAGILLSAFAAWSLLAPLGTGYRRGGLSVVCAFATVLAMLVCIPVHQFLGRNGLFILLGICGIAGLISARQARRLGTAG